MITFTNEEKERIFVARTQEFWPENWAYYEGLVSHEMWSRDQMMAYNFAQRLEILRYAYENSPFYKRHYDELGFHPADVKDENDWTQVPIITKSHLREYAEEMLIDSERTHATVGYTGGSTGRPCKFYADYRSASPLSWRTMGWARGRAAGALYPTNKAILGIDEVVMKRFERIQSTFERQAVLNRFPRRMINLDLRLTTEAVQHHIEVLSTLEPDTFTVNGYTGSVFLFAKHCVENKIQLPRALVVTTGASVLTTPMRETIRKAFHCPVIDKYGSEDCGFIANEHLLNLNSRNPEYYVYSDARYVEFVDEQNHLVPDGVDGFDVVTSFTNRVAPMVRYFLGDRAHRIVTPDPLKLPFDRISAIQGRETDWIIAKDGANIYPLSGLFNGHPDCVKGFQFRQKGNGVVRLLVLPNEENPNMEKEIQECVGDYLESLNGCIDLVVERVSELKDEAGKLRCFVREPE